MTDWRKRCGLWKMRIAEHPDCVRAALDAFLDYGKSARDRHRWLTAAYCGEATERHPDCTCGGCQRRREARAEYATRQARVEYATRQESAR